MNKRTCRWHGVLPVGHPVNRWRRTVYCQAKLGLGYIWLWSPSVHPFSKHIVYSGVDFKCGIVYTLPPTTSTSAVLFKTHTREKIHSLLIPVKHILQIQPFFPTPVTPWKGHFSWNFKQNLDGYLKRIIWQLRKPYICKEFSFRCCASPQTSKKCYCKRLYTGHVH